METVTTHRASGPPASPNDEPILEEQFDDLEQQHEASSVGMWVFLATEVMFFGGLIAAYTVYRATSPREVALASQHLNVGLGCLNTVILLGSSLSMALAVRAAQLQQPPESALVLGDHSGPRGMLPRNQGRRVLSRVPRALDPRFELPDSRAGGCDIHGASPRPSPVRDVLRPLFLHDGVARVSSDRRDCPCQRDGLADLAAMAFRIW